MVQRNDQALVPCQHDPFIVVRLFKGFVDKNKNTGYDHTDLSLKKTSVILVSKKIINSLKCIHQFHKMQLQNFPNYPSLKNN